MDLDQELMDALLALSPGLSPVGALERAVRAFLASDAAARLGALAGTLDIEDVSAAMRGHDRTT